MSQARFVACFVGGLILANCLLPALPALAQKTAADWPRFRGPDGQGVSPASTAPLTWSPQENIAWKADLPGPGASSPVVAGDRVYVTCYSGYFVPGQDGGSLEQLQRQLLCFDRTSGKQLWATSVKAVLPEEPKIRDHGYAASTPAVDGDRIYVFFGKTGVLAFDREGRQVWQADVGTRTHNWGSGTSPVVHGELLIVNASVESESLVALDKQTGKEVWRAKQIKESWNTPVVVQTPDGRPELIVAVLGKVLGFDPQTGAQRWSCNTDISWYMAPSVTSHAGVVYCIGGRTGGALAVKTGGQGDVTATHRLWTGRKGSNVSSPIYHEGRLYWAHEALGIAYCAAAETGEILYEQRLERAGQIYASPVLAAGRLYYLTRDGRTFVVAAKPTFELLATNTLEERGMFNGSPAVAHGQLFVRSDKYLYCVGK